MKVSIKTSLWMKLANPLFYHDNPDGHTDPWYSIENPDVLFGVYNFPHQHY